MSLNNTEDAIITKTVEPALPEPEASASAIAPPSQFARSDLQSSFGNALLASAATGDSPSDSTLMLQHQFGFGNAAVSRSLIQRKANESAPAASSGAPTDTTGASPAATTPTQGLIVEDDAETVQPGQMKKSAFLAQVRSAVNNAVAEVAGGTPLAATAAPQIESAFAQYSGQSGRQLEATIRRQVPEAAGATTAAGFIPAIVGRVRRMLEQGMPSALTGVAGVLGAIGSAVSSAISSVVEGVGSALSGLGSLFLKSRNDGAKESNQEPEAIQSQLGAGHSLDAGVRSRMESAYGQSFSSVEAHTDANAAGLSENMNARAFTVGQHIAFGTGEYQPGTLIGDALIAHELAHVVQQRNGASVEAPAQMGTTTSGALEEAADVSAMGAVLSQWGGNEKLRGLGARTLPTLRSGLRLQRCGDKNQPAPAPSPTPTPAPTPVPQPAPPPTVQFPSDCRNRDSLQAVINAHPNYTQWEIEPIRAGDNFEVIAARVVNRRPDLFVGRRAVYAQEVSSMYGGRIIAGPGRYIVLPVGWRDPNIGTLPPRPGTLTPKDPATQAIAVVYAEQTRAGANAQEQRRYIWFSIRKRIGSSRYPPDLAGVLDPGQYHAIGKADYKAAITDLTSGAPPQIADVANARQLVLDNWETGIPADAGAAYFHWRAGSTPDVAFNRAPHATPEEAEAAERRAAWDWAKQIKIAGTVPRANGWLKRIRGDNNGPLGSMYIYPGDGD